MERAFSETYRAFVAISLPEHAKDGLERAQEQFRSALHGKCVRWAKREQFHLTLKFLGNVELRRLEALTVSLRAACAGFDALQLRAGRIGFFPDARRPRVVWTQVLDGRDQLPSLQRAVKTAVAGFTGEAPEPAFIGHVTLGRCRTITRSQAEMLSMLAKKMEDSVFGEWTADRLAIIRSQLSPDGSHYTTLASAPLAHH